MQILLATDGSPQAREAAALVAGLNLCALDQILILVVDDAREHLSPTDILQTAREDLAGSPAAIDTLVRQGYADEEILAACRQWPADLLVLGAKGVTGLNRFLLGGVTARVMRYVPCSVLVVRPGKTAPRRILAGFDDSDSSRAATLSLGSFPFAENVEIELVSVLPLLDPHLQQRQTATFPSGLTELQVIDDLLAHQTQLRTAGRRVATHTLRGEPAASLLDYAQERDADLLVLGSHGSSLSERFHRFLLGSVSEKVARYAHCSVLIARQPEE